MSSEGELEFSLLTRLLAAMRYSESVENKIESFLNERLQSTGRISNVVLQCLLELESAHIKAVILKTGVLVPAELQDRFSDEDLLVGEVQERSLKEKVNFDLLHRVLVRKAAPSSDYKEGHAQPTWVQVLELAGQKIATLELTGEQVRILFDDLKALRASWADSSYQRSIGSVATLQFLLELYQQKDCPDELKELLRKGKIFYATLRFGGFEKSSEEDKQLVANLVTNTCTSWESPMEVRFSFDELDSQLVLAINDLPKVVASLYSNGYLNEEQLLSILKRANRVKTMKRRPVESRYKRLTGRGGRGTTKVVSQKTALQFSLWENSLDDKMVNFILSHPELRGCALAVSQSRHDNFTNLLKAYAMLTGALAKKRLRDKIVVHEEFQRQLQLLGAGFVTLAGTNGIQERALDVMIKKLSGASRKRKAKETAISQ